MIAKLQLENFKRFRNLSLRTADLTVLTGTNGAGKTSVLQSLLLARQITRQPQQGYVELNGVDTLARKIRGVFRFRYRHKSPRVVQV